MTDTQDDRILLVHLHLKLTAAEVAALEAAYGRGAEEYAQETDAVATRALRDPDREDDFEVVDSEELG